MFLRTLHLNSDIKIGTYMNKITDLEPKILWHYFNEILNIPRPSGKEEKMVEFLVDFGKKHHLETIVDEAKNVLIRKGATPGMENKESILLQSHIDMVCEKNNDTKHDFEKDPIEAYIDGDWVKARGTTLGADDGIGVAAQLAILASDNIKHGPIECLFTVEEETGLTGALSLKPGVLKSKRLINLDSEDDGVFCIGCAGGVGSIITFEYKETAAPAHLFFFEVKVKGLLGGHSGEDINKDRGNSIKILNRYLWNLNKKTKVYLADIQGGNLHNAIPREASAIVGVDFSMKEQVRIELNHFIKEIEDEYPNEKDFKMDLESCDKPQTVFDEATTFHLLNALYACPHGVAGMSKEIKGLVETSTNLASIKTTKEHTIIIGTSQRSSVESKKHDIKNQVASTFLLANAKVEHGDGYPGWKPNMNSNLNDLTVKSYKKLFHQEPVVQAIHAGLECGLILEKYPDMDMISIGPTIKGNHAPGEMMNIPTVEKFWKHLVDILENE